MNSFIETHVTKFPGTFPSLINQIKLMNAFMQTNLDLKLEEIV